MNDCSGNIRGKLTRMENHHISPWEIHGRGPVIHCLCVCDCVCVLCQTACSGHEADAGRAWPGLARLSGQAAQVGHDLLLYAWLKGAWPPQTHRRPFSVTRYHNGASDWRCRISRIVLIVCWQKLVHIDVVLGQQLWPQLYDNGEHRFNCLRKHFSVILIFAGANAATQRVSLRYSLIAVVTSTQWKIFQFQRGLF